MYENQMGENNSKYASWVVSASGDDYPWLSIDLHVELKVHPCSILKT